MLLIPASVGDYVAADNPVRFIEAFVDDVDLSGAGFARTTPKATGRPGYAPGDLLKLHPYGCLNRVRSSRRVSAEAGRNLGVMWLVRGLGPDFRTIADFRRDNRDAFRLVFRAVVLLCRRLDLVGRELLAVDGTRPQAVNSRRRNFTRQKPADWIKQADERIEECLGRLDRADRAEVEADGAGQLDPVQRSEKGGRRSIHYSNRPACRGCGLKPQCTGGAARRIERWEGEAVLDRMAQRVAGPTFSI